MNAFCWLTSSHLKAPGIFHLQTFTWLTKSENVTWEVSNLPQHRPDICKLSTQTSVLHVHLSGWLWLYAVKVIGRLWYPMDACSIFLRAIKCNRSIKPLSPLCITELPHSHLLSSTLALSFHLHSEMLSWSSKGISYVLCQLCLFKRSGKSSAGGSYWSSHIYPPLCSYLTNL